MSEPLVVIQEKAEVLVGDVYLCVAPQPPVVLLRVLTTTERILYDLNTVKENYMYLDRLEQATLPQYTLHLDRLEQATLPRYTRVVLCSTSDTTSVHEHLMIRAAEFPSAEI